MFSPIIRSTWLYLQHLVVFTHVAAGWCHGWIESLSLFIRGLVQIKEVWKTYEVSPLVSNDLCGFCYFSRYRLVSLKYDLILTHDTACSAKNVPSSKQYRVPPPENSEGSTRSRAFLAWRRKQNQLPKRRASLKKIRRPTKSKKRLCESHCDVRGASS